MCDHMVETSIHLSFRNPLFFLFEHLDITWIPRKATNTLHAFLLFEIEFFEAFRMMWNRFKSRNHPSPPTKMNSYIIGK